MSFDPFAHLRASDDPVALGRDGARTGRQLFARADALTARLRPLAAARTGAGAGQVLVQCSDRYSFAVAMLGAWQTGLAIAVPPGQGAGGLAQLVADARIVARITAPEDAAPAELDAGLAGCPHLRLPVDEVTTPPTASTACQFPGHPGDLAATLYTSGSTGQARGIAKRFDQLLGEAAAHAQHALSPGSTVLATVPAHHIYGLLWSVLAPLLAGARFVRSTPMHTGEIARLLTDHGADVLVAVPAHLEGLATLDALPGTLRQVYSSGAPLDAAVAAALEARGAARVTEILGSTETGGIATRRTATDPAWHPLPQVRVRADTEGQLLVRSAFTDCGAASEHPCADRIALSEDGCFRHLGRSDSVVKVGARRVDLGAIEARLRSLDGVEDAHVIALPVPGIRGHEIACVVAGPATLDRHAVHAHLSQWFEPSERPRRVRVVETLPRSDRGKIERDAVLALLQRPQPPGTMMTVGGQVFEPLQASPPTADAPAQLTLRVLPDAWCFGGHFDGQPILPGIVQINDLVVPQARRLWPQLGGLRRAQSLKFKAPITPGAAIDLHLHPPAPKSDPSGKGGERAAVRFVIELAGDVCASGSLLFDVDASGGSDTAGATP